MISAREPAPRCPRSTILVMWNRPNIRPFWSMMPGTKSSRYTPRNRAANPKAHFWMALNRLGMALIVGTIQPIIPAVQVTSSICRGKPGEERFLRRTRSTLLSAVLVVASFFVLAAKKVFDYAAAPAKEKESDFVYPYDPDQEKPTAIAVTVKTPPLPFRQSGGFTNDASHLNRTAIYGIVRIADETDIRNALQFARDNHLKVTCAGQQHSMGGQSFTHGGLVLDLRNFNRISLDAQHKTVNIQS